MTTMSCPHCGAANDDAARECPRCGGRLAALGPGQLVAGRWEVLARLGSGGMGVVYKVRDRDLDEIVALKVLRHEMARSEEMARRFLSEIKLARRVRHPNVCGIHEYGQDGGLRFIVMEYVEGVDLKRVLAGGAVPPGEAFAVGAQIAAALHAIHQAGIVHRDLKPANVMLDGQGRVRLMDFGIAKQFGQDPAQGLTATGHIVGTPEYMSPEQVRGEGLDVRSDVYSLGVLLFELFTGRPPFRSPSAVATLYQHVHEPVPIEAALAAGAPDAVVPVLLSALAKSPHDRYATAAEVERALDAAGGAASSRPGNALTLVAAALALAPQPEAEAAPQPAQRTAVPVPTAVAVPAPTVARRPYAGPAPHKRTAGGPAESPRRGAAFAVVACVLGALGVAAWLYGPALRARTSGPAAPAVATQRSIAAPPEAANAGAVQIRVPVAGDPGTLPASPQTSPLIARSASAVPTVVPSAAASPAPEPSLPAPAVQRPVRDTPAPAPADATVDRAEELFAQGRFASAMAEAKAVLLRQPGDQQAQQIVEDAEVEMTVDKRLKEARDAAAAGDRELALDKLKLGLAAKPTDARLLALWRVLTSD